MRLTTSRFKARTDIIANPPLSRSSACLVVLGALLLTFELDRRTALAPVQHLYYVPIIVAGVILGRRGGLMAALASILLYHLANPFLLSFRYEESDLVQIALFIAIGLVTAKLTDDARRLHVLATTDDLTGLHNLRSFEARLTSMIRDARQAGAPLSLVVLDVDRLKSLNDTYGHLTGAEAVRTVGQILAASLPDDAVACRYGGDEFVVAVPHRSLSQARAVADDLCRAVYTTAPVLAGRPFPETALSISVGLVHRSFGQEGRTGGSGRSDETTGEALFQAADRALYVAKEGGRNRVCVA